MHYEHKIQMPYSVLDDHTDIVSWLSNELDWNGHSWANEVVYPLLPATAYIIYSFEQEADAVMFTLLFGGR